MRKLAMKVGKWMLISVFLKSTLISVFLIGTASAEQVIVRQFQYENDEITDAGKIRACIVTLLVVAPPDSRILNFQYMQLTGRCAWKITGGVVDWQNKSSVSERVVDGSFTAGDFIYPTAFQKDHTPEGQLLGVLIRPELYKAFSDTFFHKAYSISVRWEGAKDDTVYYIDSSPPAAVASRFQDCLPALL
jgi:hypothetical protein